MTTFEELKRKSAWPPTSNGMPDLEDDYPDTLSQSSSICLRLTGCGRIDVSPRAANPEFMCNVRRNNKARGYCQYSCYHACNRYPGLSSKPCQSKQPKCKDTPANPPAHGTVH